jgi:hypothetical protein
VIGVIGGYGGVGSAALRQLARWSLGPLRVGGRRRDLAEQAVAEILGGKGEAFGVDLADASSLRAFCDGCRIVVNCSGPAFLVLDRVARAAAAAGAHYVDPGGDMPLLDRIARAPLPADRAAIVGAGMMPGLTGLLARAAVDAGNATGARLTAFVGGRGRLTPAAAADFVSGFVDGFGEPLAAWRDGARVPSALSPLVEVELPFFDDRVSAYPFLSVEAERLARACGLREVKWYTVFDGAHLAQAVRSGAAAGADLAAAAERVERAASLDAFGRRSYHVLVFRVERPGDGFATTLVLRGTDAVDLSGTAVAVACRELLAHKVAMRPSLFAEAVDVGSALSALSDSASVESIGWLEQALDDLGAVEQGAL